MRNLILKKKLETGEINPEQYQQYKVQQNPLLLVKRPYLTIKSKIPDESGNTIRKLKLTSTQKRFLKFIEKLIEDENPIRVWALKARQVFWTTLTQAIIFARTSQQKGRNAFTLGNDAPGTNYIFDMLKRYYDFLKTDYPHLAPEIEKNNRKELAFKDINSCCYVGTAGDPSAGQKFTIHDTHWSECQMDVYNYELFSGYMQAVPHYPGTMFIGEGVGSEVGTFFEKEVMKAKDGVTDWKVFFVPWFEHEEYIKTINDEQKHFLEATLTNEEKALIDIHKCRLDQLWWRRYMIINQCGGRNQEKKPGFIYPDLGIDLSFDYFNQYYPATIEGAFTAQGRSVFPASILREMFTLAPALISLNANEIFNLNKLIPGKTFAKGYLFQDGPANICFVYDTTGPWEIYEPPEADKTYILGADPRGGEEVEKNTNKLDWNAISIRCRETKKQVAFYRSQAADHDFAEQVRLGAFTYNRAIAGVERGTNGYGLPVLRRLTEIYSNIYFSELEDRLTREKTKKIGWLSNSKTRPQLIADYMEGLVKRGLVIRSKDTISEAGTFVHRESRREHMPGKHDDSLFADMICWSIDKRIPYYSSVDTNDRVMVCH